MKRILPLSALIVLITIGLLVYLNVDSPDPATPESEKSASSQKLEPPKDRSSAQEKTANPPEPTPEPAVAVVPIPTPGSKLGDPENAAWVRGHIGSFFEDAVVEDTMLQHLKEGVQDRKTLIATGDPEMPRVLIEERLVADPSGSPTIVASHASSASGMIVGLAPAQATSLSTSGTDQATAMETLTVAAEAENFQVTQESPYSPTMLEFEATESIEEILTHREKAQALPAIRYVEPDYIQTTQLAPDDPAYSDGTLWGLNNTGQDGGTPDIDINAPEAWQTRTSASDVVVAVIDTGVFYTHEDLRDNMWVNSGEIPDNGIDDDGNGFIDDVYGINAIKMDGDPLDDHFHGTHTAGTIGGQADNATGVSGVAWDVQIMALKFLSSAGRGSTSDAITCVNYATAMGAKITSNSWGGGGYSQALFDAFQAAEQANIISVAAAGNSRNDNDASPAYPASYELPGMVAVAAVDRKGELAWFSSYGRNSVAIAAPGVAIYSTINEAGGYDSFSGTSMACPHVSGALAVLSAHYPDEDIFHLVNRIVAGAKPLNSVEGRVLANGMLDLANSLNTPFFPLKPTYTSQLTESNYLVGESIYFEAEVMGDEPISYQWYHNEVPIAGADGPSLTIDTATATAQGDYRIEATNAGGSKSQSTRAIAFVETSEPFDATRPGNSILWAEQVTTSERQWFLQDLITPIGNQANYAMQSGRIGHDDTSRLMLIANGPARIEWEWKADCDPTGKDGLNLYMDGVKERSIKSVKYEATPWYGNHIEIPAGRHKLVFTYEKDAFIFAGNDAAWLADVSLQASTSLDAQDVDDDGIPIQEALSTKIAAGSSTLLYSTENIDASRPFSWKHNGNPLSHDKATLYLSSVSTNDSGRYELFYDHRFYNYEIGAYDYEQRKVIFELEVVPQSELLAPVIIDQPGSIQSGQSNLFLSASVESLLPVTYVWTFNGEIIPDATTSRLFITEFGSAKAGSYQFSVSNELGTTSSEPINVTYRSPEFLEPQGPVITDQPALLRFDAGADITIPLNVFGEGPFTYQWLRGSTAIPGQTEATLRISQADPLLHNGEYLLEVSSPNGSIRTRSIQVIVVSPGGLAAAVDQDGEDYYSIGPISWEVDETTTTDGEDAAFILGTDLVNLGFNANSRLETQIMGPATLRFKWNRQGSRYGSLDLLKDGNSTGLSFSNTSGWEQEEYVIKDPGLHVIAWRLESSLLTNGVAKEHILAWVDDVEIIKPEPYNKLPKYLTFGLQTAINHQLDIGGYDNIEVLGLPEWLEFDKSDLSLKGLATEADAYWLEVRMIRDDGTEDTTWIKLIFEKSEDRDLWQNINQSSAGGTIVGHYLTDTELTLVYSDGKLRTTRNGVDWEEQFIPTGSSTETIRIASEIQGRFYAFSSLDEIYVSPDRRHWSYAGETEGKRPTESGGQLLERLEGFYLINYRDLIYSNDRVRWTELWEDTSVDTIRNIFEYDGELLAHNEQGTEGLYRYDHNIDEWDLLRAIPARGNIVITGGSIYWTQYNFSARKYQLLKLDSLDQFEPEVIYESSDALRYFAVQGDLILLWDFYYYRLLTTQGALIRETTTSDFAGLSSSDTRTVRFGDSIFVYRGTSLARVDKEAPANEEASPALGTVKGIFATGNNVLVEGVSENLIATAGGNFQKVSKNGKNVIGVVGDSFIAVAGYSYYGSTDGINWEFLSDLSSGVTVSGSSTPTYSLGVFFQKIMISGQWYFNYSLDAETWYRDAVSDTSTPDSLAAYQGQFLKTEIEYGEPDKGTKLYSFEPNIGWTELKYFPDQFLKLMIYETGEQIALVDYNYHLISTDLETWTRFEISGSSRHIKYSNGQFYQTSNDKLILYDNEFKPSQELILPINPDYVEFTGATLYAGNSDGEVIRMEVPQPGAPHSAPAHGRHGRVETDPFLYINPGHIDENMPGRTFVGNLGFENLDLALPVSYQLFATDTSQPLQLEVSGQSVSTSQPIDFEQGSILRTRVRATDAAGQVFEDIVEVTVNDLNEAPTDLKLTARMFPGKVPTGVPLASFYSVDPDVNDTFSYQLVAGEGDADNGRFGILNSSLVVHGSIDPGEKMHHFIRVRTTDSGGEYLVKPLVISFTPESQPFAGSFATWMQSELQSPFAGDQMQMLDDDGDSKPNLFEYYLNTDPMVADSKKVVSINTDNSANGPDLVAYFRINNAAIASDLQISKDLKTWTSIPITYENGALHSADADYQLIEPIEEAPGLWKVRIRSPKFGTHVFGRMHIFYDSELIN